MTRQPLRRAFEILRIFERENRKLGVRELSELAALPVASVHRTMSALINEGLIQLDPDSGKYELGLEAYRMGLAFAARAPWNRFVLPFLRKVAAESHETACFAVFDAARLRMVTMARAEWHNAVQIRESAEWRTLHAGAGGLAVLAFADAAVISAVLTRSKLIRETENTIVDAKALRSELELIRKRGYALTRGQRLPGAAAVGVPVFGMDDIVTGCVYVSMPEQRFAVRKVKTLVRLLRESSKGISAVLNGAGTSA